jgi:hypothetical protein
LRTGSKDVAAQVPAEPATRRNSQIDKLPEGLRV